MNRFASFVATIAAFCLLAGAPLASGNDVTRPPGVPSHMELSKKVGTWEVWTTERPSSLFPILWRHGNCRIFMQRGEKPDFGIIATDPAWNDNQGLTQGIEFYSAASTEKELIDGKWVDKGSKIGEPYIRENFWNEKAEQEVFIPVAYDVFGDQHLNHVPDLPEYVQQRIKEKYPNTPEKE